MKLSIDDIAKTLHKELDRLGIDKPSAAVIHMEIASGVWAHANILPGNDPRQLGEFVVQAMKGFLTTLLESGIPLDGITRLCEEITKGLTGDIGFELTPEASLKKAKDFKIATAFDMMFGDPDEDGIVN